MTRKSSKSKPKPKRTWGRRLGVFFLWSALFGLLLFAADQALLRLSPANPLLSELQDCYQDLRNRLLARPQPDSIEELLEQPKAPSRSYFYADHQGELHFVDSLQEVPPAYRNEAQPLAE